MLLGLVLLGLRPDGALAHRWPRPPAWFRHDLACIAIHESGNGTTSRNLYGMLDGWAAAHGRGWAGAASRAEQTYRAWLLWTYYGWSPWPEHYTACGLT